jgi:alpha-glucosidase
MNYDAFMEPVTWFLTGMEKHSDAFDASKLGDGNLFFMSIFEKMAMFPRHSLDSALNQLSNHDHSRFLTRTNMTVGRLNSKGPSAAGQGVDKRLFKLATLIQMTWPGSPGIYYGDEAGQVGWTDPDCRRTYPWGHEDRELIEYTRAAVDLRKKIPCLKMGSLKDLDRGRGYIAYARFNREGCAVVIINQSEEQLTLSIPVWEAGMSQTTSMQYVFSTEPNATGEEGRVRYGRLFVALPPRSGCVYTGKFDREYKRVIPDNAEGEREIASLQDVRLPL